MGRGPRLIQDTLEGLHPPDYPRNTWRKSWKLRWKLQRKAVSGLLCQDCCPRDPDLDKQRKKTNNTVFSHVFVPCLITICTAAEHDYDLYGLVSHK